MQTPTTIVKKKKKHQPRFCFLLVKKEFGCHRLGMMQSGIN